LIWIDRRAGTATYKRTMKPFFLLLSRAVATAALSVVLSPAQSQSVSATRGELLYEAHCGACHSTQMHWREKRLATNWDTLKAQVRRWQGTARLGWSEAEVVDVARYLNDTIYRYPQTSDRVSLLVPTP
jgi:mono/diheme cytochrome c family protein